MDTTNNPRLARAAASTVENGIRRVLVLAYRDLADPTAGGSELYVHEVLRRWAAADIDVHLRTVAVPGEADSVLRDGYTVTRRGGHGLGVFANTLAAATRLRRAADAVVEIWNGLPFWTPVWWRGPQVAVLHHLHDELWRSNFPAPVAAAGSFVERRIGPRAYGRTPIATLSDSSAADLAQRTPLRAEQITVVPPGVSPAFQPTIPKTPDPLVVAAGRLVEAKRFDAVIDAFDSLRSVASGARLVIIGEGPAATSLQDQIRRLGLGDSVELAGWIDEGQLIDLYSSAWLLAASSISEGWGMTITEAAACGTPSLASDVVGHRDAMRFSAGRLFGSDRGMAEAMLEMTSDGPACHALGVEARNRSAQLTWDETAAAVLELLSRDAEARR